MSELLESNDCKGKRELKEITNRLVRLETKLVRGFEEMGINIDSDDWIFIDDAKKTITLTTIGRSLKVLLKIVNNPNKKQKVPYSLCFEDEIIGELMLNR